MVGMGQRTVFEAGGEAIGVLVRPHAVCVSVGQTEVYTFESSGRLHAAFDRGHHFRRGLDGRVLASWRVRQNGRDMPYQRRYEIPEGAEIVSRVHQRVGDVLRGHDVAQRIAAWDQAAYETDAARYDAVYRPVSILPPDQYLSVVVQATEGCSWNRCTFCDFYRDRAFRIRPKEELDRHIADVRNFIGAGLAMRRSIFLGDAHALSVPYPALEEMFAAVRKGFPEGGRPGPSWRNVYAFVDAWGGRKRKEAEIAELKAMGLRRVYLGLETGHDPLLDRVNKRGNGALSVELVRRFKAAGVQVGVIVLLGLGGAAYADDHVWDTTRVLNEMGLGRGDLVYFSELVASSHLPYTQDMWAANIRALTADEMAAQRCRIEAGLAFCGSNRPKLALYNIRRFVY